MDTVTHELLVEGSVLVECCEARAHELEKQYEVEVLRFCAHGLIRGRHCGMPCLNQKES